MIIVIGSAFGLFLRVSGRRFTCEGTIFSPRKVGDDPQDVRGSEAFFGEGGCARGDPQREGERGCLGVR